MATLKYEIAQARLGLRNDMFRTFLSLLLYNIRLSHFHNSKPVVFPQEWNYALELNGFYKD